MYFRMPGRLPRPDETITRSPTAKFASEIFLKVRLSVTRCCHSWQLSTVTLYWQLTGWTICRVAGQAVRRRNGARSRRRHHGWGAHIEIAGRWQWIATAAGDRFTCQTCESRKYASFRFALEVSFARNATVIFAVRIVEYDAGPVAGCKMCFANVGNVTGPNATDPYSLADYETVRVAGQHDAVVCGGVII